MNLPFLICPGTRYELVEAAYTFNRYRCATCGREFTQSHTTTLPPFHAVEATVASLFQPSIQEKVAP